MLGGKFTAIELKKINKNRIYQLIYEQKEIARQEIARELSLSLPTVNQNLKELQEEGLIDYVGNFKSTGGRKPQSIVPVKDARVAIGIEIRKNYLRMVTIDMFGHVQDYEKYLKVFSTNEEYGEHLAYLVNNMVEHNELKREKILGVGISMPGIVDADMKYVVKIPSFEIQKVSVENLIKHMEFPCIVDNDANAGAFAEYWNELPRKEQVYLSVEKGVGGSIIKKDGIRAGSHFRAGEFGHMTIVPNGRRCYCGQKGCLEAYISTARLSEDFDCQIEDFFSILASGNKEYQKVWKEYLDYLCLGINNINMMYDSDVILGGVLAQYLQPYLGTIQEKLAAYNSFGGDGKYLKLTRYQSKSTAIGIALQLVSKFIEEIY